MLSATVPGKVFVIGEYGALYGGKAVIAALHPGYTYECRVGEEVGEELSEDSNSQVSVTRGKMVKIHPESPIGRYVTEREEKLSLKLLDSSMAPGFGSSTAELIVGVNADLGRLPEIKRLWDWYKDVCPHTSGADLIVQFEAFRTKHAIFTYLHGDASPVHFHTDANSVSSKIQVFQIDASHKLPTHEALRGEIPKLNVAVLNKLVERVEWAFETNSLSEFKALSEFAEVLHGAGIESPAAFEIRSAFAKVPGVVGVKGCGAGMNDVFLVAGEFPDLQALQVVAQKFKLISLGNLKELLW